RGRVARSHARHPRREEGGKGSEGERSLPARARVRLVPADDRAARRRRLREDRGQVQGRCPDDRSAEDGGVATAGEADSRQGGVTLRPRARFSGRALYLRATYGAGSILSSAPSAWSVST